MLCFTDGNATRCKKKEPLSQQKWSKKAATKKAEKKIGSIEQIIPGTFEEKNNSLVRNNNLDSTR